MFEVRVHGLGGQGAVTLVTWVARAGYEMGKHVQAFPFFGAERRGAPVKAFLRISDEPINVRSQVYNADLLLVMSSDYVGMALEEGISPEGRLLVNAGAHLAGTLAGRLGRDVYYLDATGIALDLGLEVEGMPMVNIPLFGAVVSQSGTAPIEVAKRVIGTAVADQPHQEAYAEAVARGFAGVRKATAGVDEAGPAGDATPGGACSAGPPAEAPGSVGYVTSLSRPVMGAAGDTGEWRVFMPVKDPSKCNKCLLCWIYCPEATISKDDIEIDYRYCKGCGVCERECPTGAMTMIKEEKR